MFVITARAEPTLRVPCSRGPFKAAEGGAGVVLDVIRVRARGSKRGAKINRLRSKDGDLGWGVGRWAVAI